MSVARGAVTPDVRRRPHVSRERNVHGPRHRSRVRRRCPGSCRLCVGWSPAGTPPPRGRPGVGHRCEPAVMRRRRPRHRAARSSSRRRRVRWRVPSHRRGPRRSRSRRRSASCLARCAGATGTRTVRLWMGLSWLRSGSRRWGRRSLGRPVPVIRPPAFPPAGRLRSTESPPRRSGRFREEGYVLRSVDDCSGNHAGQAVKCAA